MYLRKTCCLLLAIILQPALADAQNLIQNPDFSNGMNGWTSVAGGIATIDSNDGSPAAPSLHETGSSALAFLVTVNSSCVQIAAPQNVDLFANIKFVSGQQANVILNAFQETNCTTVPPAVPEPFGFVIAPLIGTWSVLSTTNIPLPSGTQSVQVQLNTVSSSGINSADAYFDHVLFGPTGATPVRLQSFEVK